MTWATTIANENATTLTAQSIIDAVKKIPKCPIAEAMRSYGCDPGNGWILILPISMKSEFGDFPPRYVRFSIAVDSAVMVRDAFGITPPFAQQANESD